MFSVADIKDFLIRVAALVLNIEKKKILSKQGQIKQYEDKNTTIKQCDYLFIGDSHTFALNNYLPTKGIINIGINGDTTYGILQRYHNNIENIKAGNIFIQIGYNDFKFRSLKSTLRNYDTIIQQLKQSPVYLISLFPVNHQRRFINEQIIKFNIIIKKKYENSDKFFFTDVHCLLYDSDLGGIKPDLTSDGTHLNAAGNKILADEIGKLMIKAKAN